MTATLVTHHYQNVVVIMCLGYFENFEVLNQCRRVALASNCVILRCSSHSSILAKNGGANIT